MGMPAATITSQTAHGGIVMVGFPQVLIGMMPASRIGDMHVCPMVTGIVPHVGGPFVLGSMTVLVGMMPQSRVTDQLVCVGPPDVAVMGCETVLVGEAGAGGAAGAMGGISAMGASVPVQPPATTSSPQATAELQQDGTIKTSAPAGGSLPPITLSSPGFPDLPAVQTPNFQSVQPVTVPPGATLYRVIDNPAAAAGGYWTPDLPASEDAWRQSCAVGSWNNDGLLAAAQVPADGLKAWMGPAAGQSDLPGGGTQIWTPPGTLQPAALTQSPWSGPMQQAQQAAQQSLQGAQLAANQATQAEQQAQQAAQQGTQQAAQQAQQAANQAQQAAQQADQQAQQAANQAQQAANQAAQQAQLATGQAKAAAQQAAAEAQQQAQQTSQQAQQAASQAQQASQQGNQSAQQAQQAAQAGLPKGIA
jgi:uncharacterized Zn-binding protein involved in type VI secretion